MIEEASNLKTVMRRSEDGSHVYEILRDLGNKGGNDLILITLFPTQSTVTSFSSSTVHLLNHANDEELNVNRVHFVFLFSRVAKARLSTRGLTVDRENLEYLKAVMRENPDAKIVIAYGASMQNCPAAIQSKVELFKAILEVRPGEELWQLDAPGMDEEAPHVLFAGIKYGSMRWRLARFKVPWKYTEQGHEEYLRKREEEKKKHVKGVFGAVSTKNTQKLDVETNGTEYNQTEHANNNQKEYPKNNESDGNENYGRDANGNVIVHVVKKRRQPERKAYND